MVAGGFEPPTTSSSGLHSNLAELRYRIALCFIVVSITIAPLEVNTPFGAVLGDVVTTVVASHRCVRRDLNPELVRGRDTVFLKPTDATGRDGFEPPPTTLRAWCSHQTELPAHDASDWI